MKRIVPVIRSGRAFVRFNSSSSEASLLEDKALVSSFHGFIPKLTSAFNTITNAKDYAEFKKLIDDKVLLPNYLAALSTFTQLQNPVLKKYNFNPVEFVEGATEAFKQLHLAIASTEFSKFCNGERQESPKADLLKSSLSPFLYNACTKAARHLYKGEKTLVMTDVNVSRRALLSLETFIHVDLYAQNKKLVDDLVNAIKEETAAKSSTTKEAIESAETATKSIMDSIEVETEESNFAEGSVVVRATMIYEAEESYAESNNLSNKHNRVSNTMWTFEGCISGQTELDWQVVAFDGMGSERNKIPLKITRKESKDSESS